MLGKLDSGRRRNFRYCRCINATGVEGAIHEMRGTATRPDEISWICGRTQARQVRSD